MDNTTLLMFEVMDRASILCANIEVSLSGHEGLTVKTLDALTSAETALNTLYQVAASEFREYEAVV